MAQIVKPPKRAPWWKRRIPFWRRVLGWRVVRSGEQVIVVKVEVHGREKLEEATKKLEQLAALARSVDQTTGGIIDRTGLP